MKNAIVAEQCVRLFDLLCFCYHVLTFCDLVFESQLTLSFFSKHRLFKMTND